MEKQSFIEEYKNMLINLLLNKLTMSSEASVSSYVATRVINHELSVIQKKMLSSDHKEKNVAKLEYEVFCHNRQKYQTLIKNQLINCHSQEELAYVRRLYFSLYHDIVDYYDEYEMASFKDTIELMLADPTNLKLNDYLMLASYITYSNLREFNDVCRVEFLNDHDFKKAWGNGAAGYYHSDKQIIFNRDRLISNITKDSDERIEHTKLFSPCFSASHETTHAFIYHGFYNGIAFYQDSYLEFVAKIERIAKAYTNTSLRYEYSHSLVEYYCNVTAYRKTANFFEKYLPNVEISHLYKSIKHLQERRQLSVGAYALIDMEKDDNAYYECIDDVPHEMGDNYYLSYKYLDKYVQSINADVIAEYPWLSFIYNQKGIKKDIADLCQDCLNLIKGLPSSTENILDFYSELIIDQLDYLKEEDISNYTENHFFKENAILFNTLFSYGKEQLMARLWNCEETKKPYYERGRTKKIELLIEKTKKQERQMR